MTIVQNYNPLEDEMFRIMDNEGVVINEAFRPADLTDDLLKKIYEEMVFFRIADAKFNNLQRQGRMGTYPSMQGQEACQIPVAHVLKKEDWIAPAFRELGIMVMHGVPLEDMYKYWGGLEIGSRMPEGVNVLPVSIPVGSQLLHAVGIAWALKLQKKPGVTLPFFGDGATSEGDFHAAMNFAGVYKTPTVFMCQNNQYAISTPRTAQTMSKTLAQKALAYGFNGIQVDGNDAMAMYAAAKEAVEYARAGNGPTLIEAVTFRQGPHTSSDDPKKYIPDDVKNSWLVSDPIKRLKQYLVSKKMLTDKEQETMEQKATDAVSAAVEKYEQAPLPTIDDLFDYVYETPTPELEEQKNDLKQS